MTRWYEAAEALLSTSHHEGSGYAVLEAMGVGCPVVAFDIAPLRSICGRVGRWFGPGQHELAAAMVSGALPSRPEVVGEFESRASWTQVGRSLVAAWSERIDERSAA
jgi:glycosyltransferase involved in cell wall biosynthesis